MDYRVLGSLDVIDGERVVHLGPPKQRALLAVLLLDANRAVSLDRLIDMLWGDQPPPRATASLQIYVSKLRRALEPEREPRTPAQVLVTRPPGYLLRVGPDEVDAWRFEAAAAEGHRLLLAGRTLSARTALVDALGLWRGDALSEFAYDDFARSAIVRWEELRHTATEDRIEADLALGAHIQVVGELEARLARFPARERLWALLMAALFRCERQADALRVASRARAALREELGVEPGATLLRLERDILANAPFVNLPSGFGVDTAQRPAPEPWSQPVGEAAGPTHRRELVGRDAPLAVLDAALHEVTEGGGRVVLVTGEPGIGKTRLAEELSGRAVGAGAVVAWGRAPEDDGVPAFHPWVQVLRALLPQADPVALRAALRSGAGHLVHLVPDMAFQLGDPAPPPPLDVESARFRLCESIVAALRVVAARAPVVVVLDDLHWADISSLAVFAFVAARLEGSAVLLVGTYRPGDVDRSHPLVTTLASLARLGRLERVALEGLNPEEVGRFISEATGTSASPQLAGAFHARTDGNPFFLAELVKLLVSERALDNADCLSSRQVPVGVRDVLRRRLARLPEATNALLRVAAIIGRAFDLAVLVATAGTDEEQVLEAVEGAVLIGIVDEDPATIGRWHFTHALVQEALYDDLSAVRRARLHAKVGAALESLPDSRSRVSELARHFLRASSAVGPERAIEYSLQAAEAAQLALAYETSEGHLRAALAEVSRLPAGVARDRHELRIQNRLALSLVMGDALAAPAAPAAWRRAAALAVELGETRELLASMVGLSTDATLRSDWGTVTQVGEEMVALGVAADDPLCRAAGMFAVGNAALFRGELRQACALVAGAVAMARPLHDERSEAVSFFVDPLVLALVMLGVAASLRGDEKAGAMHSAEAVELARASGLPFWIGGTLWCGSLHRACEGDRAGADILARECVTFGRAHGMTELEAAASAVVGWSHANISQLRAGIAACDRAGFRVARGLALGLLADACRANGDFEDAVRAADEALAECDATGERLFEAEIHRIRAVALADAGSASVGEVDAGLRRALEVARAQGAVTFARRAEESLGRVAAYAFRPPPTTRSGPAGRNPSLQRSPMVGREAERRRLTRALDDAIALRGVLVLVSGEPGIGKTRLVEDLAERASGRGALVVWGRVDEDEGAPPYWPWIELVRAALADGEKSALARALGDDAGVIAAILPEVKELVGSVVQPPVLAGTEGRFRLHQAVVDFLARLSSEQRMVVVLEDIQGADVASLELAEFLAARMSTVPILLLVTYRSVDAGDPAPFDDARASLARRARERLTLTGLSEKEVGRLIAVTVGIEAAASAVSAIHSRTEGNPFFVGELARLLGSEGFLSTGPDADEARAAAPTGMRAVVRHRLACLPEATIDLLVLGAVVGTDFDLSTLSAAADLSGADTLDRIGPAVDAGLVVDVPNSVDTFRFSHALVRDTVYGELTALWRSTLHGRVGAALEQRKGPARPGVAELARHFFQAAAACGPDPGLAYMVEAADAARAAMAYEQAETDLRRALRLIEMMPTGPERAVQELSVQNRLAALYTLTRGPADPDVGPACARARALAQEVGQTAELIATVAGLADFHFPRADFNIVLELGEQLLTIGDQHANTMALAVGHTCKGLALPYFDRLGEARASLATALPLARTIERSNRMAELFRVHPLVVTLTSAARFGCLAGDHEEATAAMEEAVEVARQLDHEYSLAFALYMASLLAVLNEDPAEAEEWAETTIAACATRGFRSLDTRARVLHGWAIAQLGRHEEGVAEMNAALAEHSTTGSRLNIAYFLSLLSDGERLRGNTEHALALNEEGLCFARSLPDRIYEAEIHRRKGELLARLGQAGTAMAALRDAVSIARTQGAITFERRAQAALASARGSAVLSARERELLGMVGRGLTDKEIAGQLVISVATVHSHLDRIRDKTGRRRRPELSRLADELGLSGF